MSEELALRDRHDRERLDTILKQAARIDALEADLAQWVRQAEDNSGGWQRASLRIEALEAALRKIADGYFTITSMEEIARAALAPEKK